jgi:hypothetical protein
MRPVIEPDVLLLTLKIKDCSIDRGSSIVWRRARAPGAGSNGGAWRRLGGRNHAPPCPALVTSYVGAQGRRCARTAALPAGQAMGDGSCGGGRMSRSGAAAVLLSERQANSGVRPFLAQAFLHACCMCPCPARQWRYSHPVPSQIVDTTQRRYIWL